MVFAILQLHQRFRLSSIGRKLTVHGPVGRVDAVYGELDKMLEKVEQQALRDHLDCTVRVELKMVDNFGELLTIVTCPHCSKRNRLKYGLDRAVCGDCHASLSKAN